MLRDLSNRSGTARYFMEDGGYQRIRGNVCSEKGFPFSAYPNSAKRSIAPSVVVYDGKNVNVEFETLLE